MDRQLSQLREQKLMVNAAEVIRDITLHQVQRPRRRGARGDPGLAAIQVVIEEAMSIGVGENHWCGLRLRAR